MNYWNKIVLSLVTIAIAVPSLHAGISDTIVLDKVVAKGIKFGTITTGAKFYSIDSLTLKSFQSGSLADLLQQQSLVAVRTHGPGGLATVSIRGGSSRHTAIIWNGLNLRSPMSGEMNFSSLPAGFIDEVSIQPGGSSTMYGSGAASGVIFLSNSLELNGSGWNSMVNTELASFATYSGTVATGFQGKVFASRLKFGYQQAENDFAFTNTDKYNHPTDTLRHAGFNRKSFIYQSALKVGKHGLLETDFWYLNYFKEIPPLTSDYDVSQAVQQDNDLRLALNYSNYWNRLILRLRSGILYDNTYYYDPVEPAVETSNISHSYINEAEVRFSINPVHTLFFGVNYTFEDASSQGYTANASRIKYAAFGRYNISMLQKRLLFSIETRQEVAGRKATPFIFSVGGNYRIMPKLLIKGVIARHYALPILDDLFWKEDGFALGNPDLKAEYGWNYEFGLEHKIVTEHFTIQNEITWFFHHTYDLIIWLPLGEDNKWTPQNVDDSKSKGIEYSGYALIGLPKSAFEIRYAYSYTNALIFDERRLPDPGSPRMYVPKHNACICFSYSFNELSFRYTHSYTGKSYYDESHILNSYMLGNVQFGYRLKCKRMCIDACLKIGNVFNTSYQVMKGYAQPPRNIALETIFKF
jgi:vitamin B12 transporter